MDVWNQAVDVLREAMFVYAQASNGNLGLGIITVTFLARLALFPVTLRLARRAARQREVMRRLEPELAGVRSRFKDNPQRLAEETRRLFAREGASMIPAMGCLGALLQTPVFLALFSAVRQCAVAGGRFLWIRDISRPDIALAVIVAALTAGSMAAGPQPETAAPNRLLMLALPAVFTLITLGQMASGVGLYWGVSSVVGLAQGVILRREFSGTARG